MIRATRVFLPVVLLASIAIGCGGPAADNRPSVASAEGVVTFNGTPLADATIVFAPVSGQQAASGTTDAQGHFVMRAFQDEEGVVPGDYKVSVKKEADVSVDVAGDDDDDDDDDADPYKEDANAAEASGSLIPDKYTSPDTSELTVTIPAGGKTDIEFALAE